MPAKKQEKPPTISRNDPLQKGSRWIWIPVLTGVAISTVVEIIIAVVTA